MIVRRLDALPEAATVSGETWTSRRLLLAADRMGFSLHDTLIRAGTETPMWYRNHLEAVYCVSGAGHVRDLATGQTHPLAPGTLYALDRHDRHVLFAESELRTICVFSPPLVGPEAHDADGSYPLLPSDADPYPSRRFDRWRAIPRQDPVIWSAGPDPLSSAQLEAFDAHGFLVLEGWLDPALAAGALESCHDLARTATDTVVREPDSDVVRSVFRVHRDRGRLAALCRDERLAGAARQILGSEVYIHQSRVNFKPALDGREFAWHSDFETWHVEDGMPRMRALTACVLLTASTEFNGPLMLVPRSHRTFVSTVGATPERHYEQSLRQQRYGVPEREALQKLVAEGGITSCKGEPGTVVLFDCNAMHASGGNLSPSPRTSLFFVYNSVHNALAAPFSGQPPRPDHIAERAPDPL